MSESILLRAGQLDFFTSKFARKLQDHARRVDHGGEIREDRRKLARPFDPKRALHLTLRSDRAKREWSMLRFEKAQVIKSLVYRLARENEVRIYQRNELEAEGLIRYKPRVKRRP